MANFDVESLFTNVPLLETTEIIVDNIQTTHLNKFGLTKDSFKKLLNIAAHHSVFSYNDDLYMQTDGVAMGSPLGPSYANAFLCHHEINWLKQCPPEFRPVYYRRYIDALAVVEGVRAFDCYVYGRRFYIYTDHRPLIYVFSRKPRVYV